MVVRALVCSRVVTRSCYSYWFTCTCLFNSSQECIHPKEPPIVQEISSVLREWSSMWKQLFVVSALTQPTLVCVVIHLERNQFMAIKWEHHKLYFMYFILVFYVVLKYISLFGVFCLRLSSCPCGIAFQRIHSSCFFPLFR